VNKLLWKRRIGRVAAHLPRARSRRVILLYHSIGESPWAVREDDFRAQLELLNCAELCSLDTLLRDDRSPGMHVALTFDDGYASLLDTAAELMTEFDATATVYLNSGLMADTARQSSDPTQGHYPDETFLSWVDVQRLLSLKWTIGSHGVQHLDLTAVAPDVALSELSNSKTAIERRTGIPCEHFSYTWGRNNSALRSAVHAAGYRFAASTHHGDLKPGYDPYAVPRINIHRDYSMADFAAIVRGDWDFLGWWQEIKTRSA